MESSKGDECLLAFTQPRTGHSKGLLMRTRSTRAVFSVRQLAEMAGMEKKAMARMLEANGIEFGRTGTKRVVYLSDLHAAMPRLMDSIRYGGAGDE